MAKKLFLSDAPIEELTEDAFGHKAFIDTLQKCVKDCDSGINIGLFGKWGVGKTSIINLLLKKFESDNQKIKSFLFDAWKYSHGSLRQEFILKINEKYKILNQEKLEKEIYSIQEEEAPPTERGWQNTLQRMWLRTRISTISALSLLALLLSLYFTNLISISVYTWILLVLFFPMIVQLVKEVNSAVSSMGKVMVLPAKFDPGRLEEKFREIVDGIIKKNKADKLVIVIDNLDRCSGKAAIEMLEAIKTFMGHDKCVYLLPCDNSALINHLVSVRKYKESDALEFLRKFFQTSLTIPSFLDLDLEKFAGNLLSDLEIHYSQEVLQVIVSAFMENPRSIKQFLNNLTTQYLAAQEREKAGIVGYGDITNNDGFLAKSLVIRQEFHSFYQKLASKEDLLDDVETYFKQGGEPPFYNGKSVFDDSPGLERLLKSTRPISVKDISPFLKLNKQTYPSTIPDAKEFKLQVNNGNVDYILSSLGKLKQEEERIEYVWQIVRVIDDESRVGNYAWVFNGVDMLTKIYEQTPVAVKPRIAAKIGHYMTLSEMQDNLGKFNYGKSFPIFHDIEEAYRNDILNKYSGLLTPKEIDQDLIDQFIKLSDIFPKVAVEKLNNVLSDAWASSNRKEALITIRKLNQVAAVNERLVSENLVATVEQSIDTSLTTENKEGIDLYLELRVRSPAQTKLSFLQKVLGIISTNRNSVYDETKEFGLQTLLRLDSIDIPNGGVEGLYNTLNEFTGLMNPPNEKLQFIIVFFWLFDVFTQSQQEEFLHNHLLPLIDSGNASILNNMLETADGYDVKILAYDFVLDRLTNRVRTNLPDSGLIESITRNTPREDKQKVKDMIIDLINRPEPPYHNAGLENFKQLYSEFRSSQIGEICDACLQRGTSVPQPEKQKFINPILEAFEKCPAQFKRRFADFISGFITDDDTNIRDMGIDCFNRIEALIEEGKKKSIIIQLLQAVEQKANQDEIDEDSEPLLDLVIAEQAILERNDKVRLIDTLLGLRNEAKDKEVRLIGLKYLGRVDKFHHRKKLVIETLQADLESADKEIREQAKQTVEALKAPTEEAGENSPSAESSPGEF